ncbi:DUF342 domain-containing protein [Photobacterium galatheae]|uniref:Flagellar Assembly Protein A N-terminal region domain-containing protein n=1 Tax=Photobacterium galatheae TaxID=1654360 RepID=A0A066RQY1_9GAMM|nr:FapA family protein [Photobacterium galatheae]KDM90087.1 hypothetical protein EA58_19325 [Photobacterium galatheae]MCM0150067.1 DUF342 domain-containing protein [Photobacterium galatheae]
MLESLFTLEPKGAHLSLIMSKPEDGDSQDIDSEAIDAFLAASPFHDYLRLDSAIQDAVQYWNNQNHTGDSAFVVAERKDVQIDISLSDDHMCAFVTLTGAFGGEKLTAQVLIDALKSQNIVRGVSKKRLQYLLQKSWELTPGETYTLKVAAGRPADHGKDTAFDALVPDASERILAPQDSDHGKVDMRNLGQLITVQAGQALMRRTPPTHGAPGYDIHGQVVDPTPGKEIPFQVGVGTRLADDDSNVLVADKDGMPRHGPTGMAVDDILSVEKVDVTTGHIDFNGAVLVYGDVSSGMKIKAAGNITVTGVVELAELEAGGDITVAGGVIGRMHEGKLVYCSLKAQGQVAAKFAQYAQIESGADTALYLHLAHSLVNAKGAVRVSDAGQRHGSVTGGVIVADGGVYARVLGAEAGVETQIQLMGRFRELKAEMDHLKAEMKEQEERIHQLVVLQMKLSKQPREKRSPELVEKVKTGKAHFMASLADMKTRYQQLHEQYDQELASAKVEVSHMMHAGVHVRIEEREFVAEQDITACLICWQDQKIVCQPLKAH